MGNLCPGDDEPRFKAILRCAILAGGPILYYTIYDIPYTIYYILYTTLYYTILY